MGRLIIGVLLWSDMVKQGATEVPNREGPLPRKLWHSNYDHLEAAAQGCPLT
jgi:hypothetical protein